MSSLGSPNPFFIAGKKAYEVERSFRFDSASGTHLERTPSSTGNRQICTFSCWVKRGDLNTTNCLASAYSANNDSDNISLILRQLSSGNCEFRVVGYANNFRITNRLFRDVSAWYHIVVAFDTTQSSADDRIKVYVNGVQETSFSTSGSVTQNMNIAFNDTTIHKIGVQSNASSNYMDGYMAEVNFIDGSQLTPASFGKTNATTGQWNPIKYTGSYGTNGYYLDFSDNSSITNMCLDKSGNGNNFSPDNCNTEDSMLDTPTNNFATLNALDFTGGSLVEGNLKQDNSGATNTSGTFGMQSGKWYWEIYFNNVSGGIFGIGIGESRKGSALNDLTRHYGYATNGQIYTTVNGSSTAASYGNSLSAGDILGVKYDADARELHFLKNNVSQGSAISVASGFLYLAGFHANNSDITVNFGQDSTFAGAKTAQGNTDANGIGNFFYAVPSGFKAMCSANLPDPTIKLPNKHFDTLLYSGTGSSNSITGLNFAPDWVWAKRRNAAGNHHLLIDQVRGGDKSLSSNLTDAENSNANRSMTFNSNGVTWNSDTGNANASGGTYVLWNWDAGETDGKTYTVTVVSDSGNKYRFDGFGTSAVTLDLAEGGTYIFNYPSAHPFKFSTTADGTHGGGSEYTTGVTHNSSTQVTIVVAASAPTLYYYCGSHSGMGGQVNTNSTLGSSNFDGAIQSTVKVNATAGFSITNFYPTAAGTAVTTGHGLGVTPDVAIVKSRGSSANWDVLHMSLGSSYKLYLNGTNAQISSGAWGSTDPTSSVFTYNPGNQNNNNQIAYCFSEVAGYSKFGSYTGNGNADGTFVFTGFRPAFILHKDANSTEQWQIKDTARDTSNPVDVYLHPNLSNAENTSTNASVDFLSNGFKIRTSDGSHNTSGNTYIYLAFAESPFRNARAR